LPLEPSSSATTAATCFPLPWERRRTSSRATVAVPTTRIPAPRRSLLKRSLPTSHLNFDRSCSPMSRPSTGPMSTRRLRSRRRVPSVEERRSASLPCNCVVPTKAAPFSSPVTVASSGLITTEIHKTFCPSLLST
ncbi:hypothetical protein CT0861_01195, partial [Colletotrichum tofieldiae]